jgi:hydrogenase maturation protease
MSLQILVAGLGNIFMGDDGFGVAVAHELAKRSCFAPDPCARVVLMDVGIRGLDLAYALLEDYDAAVLIDVLQRGRAPGTLYVIEPVPSQAELTSEPEMLDTHDLNPGRVLRFVQASGAALRTLRLVGCEPAFLPAPEDPHMGLSEEVARAVMGAADLVQEVVAELLQDHQLSMELTQTRCSDA